MDGEREKRVPFMKMAPPGRSSFWRHGKHTHVFFTGGGHTSARTVSCSKVFVLEWKIYFYENKK